MKSLIKISLIFGILLIFACKNENTKTSKTNYIENFICDAEKNNDSVLIAKNNDTLFFQGLKQRTDQEAKSGKYSLKLDSVRQFAFAINLYLKPQTYYQLSFWAKDSTLKSVLAVVQGENFYKKSYSIIENDTIRGWHKIALRFFSPADSTPVSLYIWNVNKKNVFVDDFTLEIFSLPKTKLPLLFIYTNDKAYKKLLQERSKALKKGVLQTDDNSWVKAMILFKDNSYKTKIRLKGDWLDHLEGKKWSFRIKIKNNLSFKGMKVFSIQNPNTRHYLDQWFLYQIFRTEGLLAPRYGFINGQINDDFVGIYAYEEHFQKQLVESQKRREGPILKHTEETFWDLMIFYDKNKTTPIYPVYEASKIEPFSVGKTLKNNVLSTEFNIAKNLLYQHKYGLANISELFDVKKAAKFFALINIMQGWHGFMWHNQRFYYNPITSKLEYIVYDNYIRNGIYNVYKQPIFGDFNPNLKNHKPEEISNFYLFKDSIFVQYYIDYLKKYSKKSFWDSVFNEYNDTIFKYQQILFTEFDDCYFDKQIYYNQAKRIREALPEYIEKVNNGLYDSLQIPVRKPDFYNDTIVPELIVDYVNIYTQKTTNDSVILKIANFFLDKISVTGYVENDNKHKISAININPYQSGDYKKEITINKPADFLIINYKELEFLVPVLRWSEPTAWSPRQELEQNNKFPDEPYYSVSGKNVIFNGKQTIDKIILIPQHYNVTFEQGTEINFINGGGFLSYSPVYINGTAEKPVKIYSSDKSARGFTILQGDNVVMNYATFDGLNTFDYKGWTLSGAVTIYESETKINNCKFINNLCEDDLNIVRSNFDVQNSDFINTFSDAFDSDFCTGKVKNCNFNKLGNDAIDFSTSQINIEHCIIKNATDKGISGGEASQLNVSDCSIDGANIAIASKDKSVLYIQNTSVNNVTYVLTAFQKKPEYGEATIIANKLSAKNYIQLSLIEQNSTLTLDGLTIEGKEKNVAKKFY